jgi:hypothetical protein
MDSRFRGNDNPVHSLSLGFVTPGINPGACIWGPALPEWDIVSR